MTDWPARGQKAPNYWDLQTKAYVDEQDATLQTQINNITASDVESVASIQSDGGGDVPAALLKIALNLPDDTVDELSGLQTQINDIEASDVETVAGVPPTSGDVEVANLKMALNLPDDTVGVEATLVRFRDLDGNPIAGKVVTITVDTDTDQVEDIIVEDVP